LDGDRMHEVLDGWGNPIEFLRWAPGYSIGPGEDGQWGVANTDDDGDNITDNITERGWTGSDDERISDLQLPDPGSAPDPFDPLRVDDDLRSVPPLSPQERRYTFALYPLLYSAGRDGIRDIIRGNDQDVFHYAFPPNHNGNPQLKNDPFFVQRLPNLIDHQFGMPWDADNDGPNHLDNITNHEVEAR
jgi:hypothetical protein